MSIRLRLIMVLVTMSTLAMVALSVVFMAGNLLLAKGRDDASHQRVVNTAQRSLERSLTDQAAAVRLYVLSANERALIPYRQGLDVERTASTALEIDPLLAENVHIAVANVRQAAVAWRDRYVRVALDDLNDGRIDVARSAISLGLDKDLFDRVRVRLDALDEHLTAPATVVADAVALLSTIRVIAYGASLIGGIVALLITLRALGALVWKPLRMLVDTARQVEAGADVSFRLPRRDEIGDLAASLERMRNRIDDGRRVAAATAQESSIVNSFTELTAFTETDIEVAEAMLTAVDELVAPDSAVVPDARASA